MRPVLTPVAVMFALLAALSCAPPIASTGSKDGGGTGGGGAGSGGSAGSGGGGAGSGGSQTGGGSGTGGGGGGGGSDGTAGASGSDAGNTGPDTSATLPDVKSCGEQTAKLPHAPSTPDVIIAFDKSASMLSQFGVGKTRYTTERDLLKPLVMQYQDRIRWGYLEFPQLTPPMAIVAPVLNNAAKVNAAIDDCGPMLDTRNPPCDRGSGTPTSTAIMRARNFYAGLNDGIKNRYVLLSTDGEPTNAGGCDAVITELNMLRTAGVKTIVLGVSDQVAASVCLDRMADAGGAPRPGMPKYYESKTPELLAMHLSEIIGGFAKPSCEIDLTMAPSDPSLVAVFFDGKQIPYDPTRMNGWTFEPGSTTRIIIHGSYCTRLQGFEFMTIDVKFGCPPCGGTVGC